MMIWWTAYFVFSVGFAKVDASAIRTDGISYLWENGTVITDTSESDFYPQSPFSEVCGECFCPPQPPKCDPGVSLITDGCGCCKVCARQIGFTCDLKNVCDEHKGLYCDNNSGTCKARPGRSCILQGKWYENGAVFSPSCKITCTCIDGDVGCIPKCKVAPPPRCQYPRLVRSESNCCGEWRCSRPIGLMRRGNTTSMTIRNQRPCILQTTPWSPCSQTCSFGVSERVTNDNEECKMIKETRLCIIRPCKIAKSPKKSKKGCRRNIRRHKRVRYTLSGCLTTKSFRPRYCGTCNDARKCCRPSSTKTVDIEFECPRAHSNTSETYLMKKKMMLIQSCKCGDFCSNNDLMSPSFGEGLGRNMFYDT